MPNIFKNRVGENYTTNEGYKVEIIEYFGSNNCTVKFEDGKVYKNVAFSHIKKGNVRNPYHRSVVNVGYLGIGKHKSRKDNIKTIKYYYWVSMLTRCYSERYQQKFPTYIGCSVDDSWHNFQNFGDWYDKNFNSKTMQGWNLDKDILEKGNKIYSPETCCFVPQEINKLFLKPKLKTDLPIGVFKLNNRFVSQCNTDKKSRHIKCSNTFEEAFQAYKEVKENYIKKIAIEYYSTGKIPLKVYNAMYNYTIEVTD